MIRLLYLLFLLLTASPGFSQSGEIRIHVSPEIESMVAEHQRINKEEGVLAGYRIQIFASPVLAKARDIKAVFQMGYPDLAAEVVLEEPDFKVVIGNYLDRFDAHHDLQRMLPQYPGAFLVRQLVAVSDL